MNWRIFFLVLINAFCICLPYNIIGCIDPPASYYQYTSFFHNDLSSHSEYSPFFYVRDFPLYDPVEPDSSIDEACAEWARYCHNGTTVRQAHRFVCDSDSADIATLADWIKTGGRRPIADRIRNNPMTAYFKQSKDAEALQYILLSKQTELYSNHGGNDWTCCKTAKEEYRDSLQMDRLIRLAREGIAHSRKKFIQSRYAYQSMSMAFYSRRQADCIRWFDELVKNDPRAGALYPAALAFKAGSLWRQGRRIEAAYDYSRAFSLSPTKKVSNYYSFSSCIHRLDQHDREQCLNFCRNQREKADLLALFLLGSPAPEEQALKTIYQLDPGSPVLETLALREVNKIEEHYLTPVLQREKGGKQLYFPVWDWEDNKPNPKRWKQEAIDLMGFYHSISADSPTTSKALYETAAAYLAYITRQFDSARAWLSRAATLPASAKLKDQQVMTSLLLTISQRPVVDPAFEAELLPSLQWLERKACTGDKARNGHYHDNEHLNKWRQFYRSLMSEIIARRYHQQGDLAKEALCIGNGEWLPKGSNEGLFYYYEDWHTAYFVENKMTTAGLKRLYHILHNPDKSGWEQFLSRHFPVNSDTLTAFIAMSAARDRHFQEALTWLHRIKSPALRKLDRNPFADVLLDRQDIAYPLFDQGRFTRIGFIGEMARLMKKEQARTATPADLYRLALGYYNMTAHGRAWEVLRANRYPAERIERDSITLPYGADYEGCYTAERYFKKALNASADRNFKARCVFMMAKCAEHQDAPDFVSDGDLWRRIDKTNDYMIHNRYFPMLVRGYGNTAFYKEAYSSCSYLREFVKKLSY